MFGKLHDGSLIESNDINDITNHGKNIKELHLNWNPSFHKTNTSVDVNSILDSSNITHISFDRLDIKNMHLLKHFDKLFSLGFYDCNQELTSLYNSKLHVLICLENYVNGNNITRLPFCVNFTRIDILNCSLISLKEISNCSNLLSLCCSKNKITSLKPLKKCTNLMIFDCDENELLSLDGIENCVKLTDLHP
jgi:hypothetical protein